MEAITRMSKQSSDNIQALLKVLILATIAGAAISSRLFSVIRYVLSDYVDTRFESIIHEFDP
jgi:dolichyl-diphosphooligosaccharide--protein glycosyltransferase